MVRRSYSSTEKFWSVMQQQLQKGAYCESVSSHIKNIFSYEELDNFMVFQEFTKDDTDFPFEHLQNKVRSWKYRDYVQKTVGSIELSEDHMTSYYGKKWFHYPDNFEFSLGDTIIIHRMVEIMKNIMIMETKEKQKMLKKSNRCPVDESVLAQPEAESGHVKTLILRRKSMCERYHQLKNQIQIEMVNPMIIISCPLCLEKIKVHKYFKGGDKSYWNLSNFYRHFDDCLDKNNDPETPLAHESNFIIALFCIFGIFYFSHCNP